jgi:predicted ester cyclase
MAGSAAERTIARNKAVVRRLVEEWQGGHRREVGEELLAEDFVDSARGTGPDVSKQRALDWWDATFRAFPDLQAEVRHMVAEDDLVATYKTFSGTHEGTFMGLAPMGRRATFHAFDLMRLRDGRVVDHWVILDVAALLRQLGVDPRGRCARSQSIERAAAADVSGSKPFRASRA